MPADRVVVTGGSSGLGAAVVKAVADAGGRPFVFDLHAPSADVPHERLDISNQRAAERAVGLAAEQMGGIDAVVAAAGIDACGRLEDVPFDSWESVIKVNLIGMAAVVRAAIPHLERVHGRIVTVASTLGLRALPDATAYCASKFGVVGFTRALQAELSGRVGVTLLVPGGMKTAFFDGRSEQYRPGPEAQLNDPAEVAAAVMFALTRPTGCEVRELLITPEGESSWP